MKWIRLIPKSIKAAIVEEYVEKIDSLMDRIEELERQDNSRFEEVELTRDGDIWTGRTTILDSQTGKYFCPGCWEAGRFVPQRFSGSYYLRECELCGAEPGYSDGHTGSYLPL